MSIFVSIPCLGNDTELIPTIKSIFAQAEKPENIHIGIAIIGNKNLYNELIDEFDNNKNIKISFYEYKDNIGVGKGRNFARSLYNNQKYILQIDPHSRMMLNWDTYLIKQFEKAKKIVNNQKIVLTGTPARYKYYRIGKKTYVNIFFSQFIGVNQWLKKENYRVNGTIPGWEHVPINVMSKNLIDLEIKNNIIPASKICAAFIFGDHFFANSKTLDNSIIFWEEEILESIELIDQGFSLMHPGNKAVISHLYTDDIVDNIGRRENLSSVLKLYVEKNENLTDFYDNKMLENWNNYFANPKNQIKIQKFESYNNFSFKETIHDLHTYPKDYINYGFLPL